MTPIRTALLALAALGLSVGSATAYGHDHGDREGRYGGGRGGAGGGGGYSASPRGGGYFGGQPRYDRAPSYEGARGYAPQGYAPRGYAQPLYDQRPYAHGGRGVGAVEGSAFAPSSQPFRRGQYLPHGYWGGEIANPKSRHLRTPPPGYGWIGVGPNAYLMQRSTGLVLDSVPGAW